MFEDNIQSCSSSSELSLVVEEKRESLNFETEILIFFSDLRTSCCPGGLLRCLCIVSSL